MLVWRVNVERRTVERTEDAEAKALKLIGVTFFLLVAFVVFESITSLVNIEQPEVSLVGVAITLSIVVMPLLATRKREGGDSLGESSGPGGHAETLGHVSTCRL